jgi:hypothetical protein
VYVLLAWYNLLQDDDLLMLESVHRAGIIGATQEQYYTWNTRWTSFFFLHSWMYFMQANSSLFLYHLCTSLALWGACFRLGKALNYRQWMSDISPVALASAFSAALLVSTYHIGDTWFWMNTSTMYGWNLIVLLLALALVLKPLESGGLTSALLNACGLFVGGAAEPATVLLLLMIPAFLVFQKEVAAPYISNLIHFLTGLCIAFAIALAGEGHSKREAALPDLSFVNLIVHSGYFSLKILVWHSPLRWLCGLGLLLPFFHKNSVSARHPLRDALLALTAWISVVVLHTLFITYIMGDYGPPRAWSFLSLWLMAVTGWWLYHHAFRINEKLRSGLQLISLALILSTAIQQFRVIPEYSRVAREVNAGQLPFDDQKLPENGLLHRMNGTR